MKLHSEEQKNPRVFTQMLHGFVTTGSGSSGYTNSNRKLKSLTENHLDNPKQSAVIILSLSPTILPASLVPREDTSDTTSGLNIQHGIQNLRGEECLDSEVYKKIDPEEVFPCLFWDFMLSFYYLQVLYKLL